MPLRRSDLVVLVARRAETNVYLGVLKDWSALGLVQDFLWVDTDAERIDRGFACIAVSDGVAVRGELTATLARLPRIDAARVVCLSQVTDRLSTPGPVRGREVFHEVRNSLPGEAAVTWIHALTTSVPEVWPALPEHEIAWTGAHNVVLAPENSQSPAAGVALLGVQDRLHPIGLTHHTAALCSAAGLWEAEARSPFSGESDAGGGQVAVLRTFTRHLAFGGIRSRVLSRLIDMGSGYPVPARPGGERIQRVDKEVPACRAMTDALVARHQVTLLQGERGLTPDGGPDRRGFLDWMRLFLKFFAKAISGGHADLLRTMERELEARIGGARRGLGVEGTEHAQVLTRQGVRRIRPDRTLMDLYEYDAALGQLLADLGGLQRSERSERQEYPELWKDFVAGGLTLLDAQRRVDDLKPVQVGSGLAVVTTPGSVVPDPADRFPVAPEIRAAVDVEDVEPCDEDLARTIHDLLDEQVVEHPEQATVLRAAQGSMKQWFAPRLASYAGELGRRIGDSLREVRREIVDIAEALRGGPDHQSFLEEHKPGQQKLARTLFGMAGGWCLLLLVVEGVGVLAGLPVVLLIGAVPLVALGWLLTSTVTFRDRQQEVFDLLHHREVAVRRQVERRQHLVEALIDLRRLTAVYRQYLGWTRALGAFVRAPLGRVRVSEDADPELGEGFGHNHGFGVIEPDEKAVEDVGLRMEAELFDVGWLSGAWDRFVEDLPEFRDRHLVQDDPDLIFTDRPVSDRSVLSQWSRAVESAERYDAAGDIEDRLAQRFADPEGVVFEQLLGTVRAMSSHGELHEVRYEDFVAGLHDLLDGPARGGKFSRALFAEVPESRDLEPWAVTRNLVSGGHGALRPLIVTQVTSPFTARDLAFGPRAEGSDAGSLGDWPEPSGPSSPAEPIAPPEV